MNNFQNEAHFFILEKFQTLTEEHHIRLHQFESSSPSQYTLDIPSI